MSDTSATGLYILTSVLLGLAVFAVALRFYARHLKKAPLLADDWILLPALLTFIATCACMYYGEDLKIFGYSSYDFTKEEVAATLERSDKTQLSFNLLSIACLGFVKMSALLFYRRIFCVGGRKAVYNVVINASLVVVAAWLVAYEFAVGFQCGTHFSAQWEGTAAKYCKIVFPLVLSLTISDLILDVWVIALPIYPVLRLQATWGRKLAILGIFLLASAGLGASSARLYAWLRLFNLGRTKYHKADTEKILSRFLFYVILELGVGIIAVCLPSIWMVLLSKAPEAFLRSVQSVVSLASAGSRRSKESRDESQAKTLQSNGSTSSHIPIAGPSSDAYELSTMNASNLHAATEGQANTDTPGPHSSGATDHKQVQDESSKKSVDTTVKS